MKFLDIFRSQVPGILKRLNDIQLDIYKTRQNIKKLATLEKELTSKESEGASSGTIIKNAIDDFGVIMWIKDLGGRFLYANNACCKDILKCTQEEALNLKNGELKKDALAKVCVQSDAYVIQNSGTHRWVEHAVYEDGQQIFIDTIKSPIFSDEGSVIGTVGNAVNITESIPDEIRQHHLKSSSIKIPVDTTLDKSTFISLLERRLKSRG